MARIYLSDLTQEYIKSILYYNPETGLWNWINSGKLAGSISAEGYLIIGIDNRLYKAHRLAFLYMTGEWPSDDVDHDNRNRRDCRWENIRTASSQKNNFNATVKSNNMCGIKGIRKKNNKWESRIKFNGIAIHLGYFWTAEEAHNAYLIAAKFYFGSFATDGN